MHFGVATLQLGNADVKQSLKKNYRRTNSCIFLDIHADPHASTSLCHVRLPPRSA